jgi:hypothetical protein
MALLPRCVSCNRVMGGVVRFTVRNKDARLWQWTCIRCAEAKKPAAIAPQEPDTLEIVPYDPEIIVEAEIVDEEPIRPKISGSEILRQITNCSRRAI